MEQKCATCSHWHRAKEDRNRHECLWRHAAMPFWLERSKDGNGARYTHANDGHACVAWQEIVTLEDWHRFLHPEKTA